MTPRYRVTVFGKPRGPWRDTKEEAIQDAIDQDLANWDQSKREWFIAVPTDIEWERERQEAGDGPSCVRSC